MISPKHYSTKYTIKGREGIILIDMLLALSLGLVFMIAITDATAYSRDIFYKAKDRNAELDEYEIAATLHHDRLTVRPYGNDREESIYSSSSLTFTSVYGQLPSNLNTTDQHALCSVDFSDHSIAGSYEWQVNRDESTSTYDLNASIDTYALPLSSTLPLTDLEVRGDIAYVSADSNSASDPDMYVFRLGERGDATLISSLNTGPGIAGFALAGTYIYAAAPSTAAQLHVIEQNSSRNLSFVAKYRLPLPYATATPALGSSVAYEDGKIYLGTEKWVGDEFSVIDVSNPAVPAKLAGIETGAKISDIFVHLGTAYVSGADQQQLRIIDVHDSSHPVVEAGFSPSGWQRQEGETSYLFEGRLDFGRTAGGYNIVGDPEAFTAASSSPFDALGFKYVDMPGGVYGIISDRLREFIITRQAGREFQIFDHTMNASSSLHFSLPTMPQALTCYGDKIYVLSHTSPAIYEITISHNRQNI